MFIYNVAYCNRLSVKWPMKILAKMNSKLCIIFYNNFMRKRRFLFSIFGKSTGKHSVDKPHMARPAASATRTLVKPLSCC